MFSSKATSTEGELPPPPASEPNIQMSTIGKKREKKID
jgi:hypothetical protein